MQFKVDSTGAWLNNSTFVLQKDNGGKILIDPKYGIVAGTKDLFDTDGTTVLPSFIDGDGELVLDRLGMPEKSNFFLDLRDGSAYFRGNVYAEDGVFNGKVYAEDGVFNGTVYATGGEFDGIIKARDFLLPNGDSMKSVINNRGKIDSDWLDLYGINVKNQAGKTVLTIDENGLRFGTGYSPIVYQFSTSASGPWHSTMGENDKYRRDSLDGGTTWGSAYQFRGEDGKNGTNGSNGSDASVTRANIVRAMLNHIEDDGLYTTEINGRQCLGINATAIKSGSISSIDIFGGGYHDLNKKYTLKFKNGLCLFSNDYNSPLEIFNIYDDLLGGTVFSSKSGVFLYNNNGISGGRSFKTEEISYPQGTWDFSYADIKGITAVFA